MLKEQIRVHEKFGSGSYVAPRDPLIYLAYFEIPDARHEEAAWAARFDSVLDFLYPVL